MGGGRLFLHDKLNLIDPCRTVRATVPVWQLRDAMPAGWVTQFQCMREYNAESPKQGKKRFNSFVKTTNIAYLGIIYDLSMIFNFKARKSCID